MEIRWFPCLLASRIINASKPDYKYYWANRESWEFLAFYCHTLNSIMLYYDTMLLISDKVNWFLFRTQMNDKNNNEMIKWKTNCTKKRQSSLWSVSGLTWTGIVSFSKRFCVCGIMKIVGHGEKKAKRTHDTQHRSMASE